MLKKLVAVCFISSLMMSGSFANDVMDPWYKAAVKNLSSLDEAQKKYEENKKTFEDSFQELKSLRDVALAESKKVMLMSSDEAKTAAYALLKKNNACGSDVLDKLEAELKAQEEKRRIEGHKIMSDNYFPSNIVTVLEEVIFGHGHRLYLKALESVYQYRSSYLNTVMSSYERDVKSAQGDVDRERKSFIQSYAQLTPENMSRIEKVAELQGTKIK